VSQRPGIRPTGFTPAAAEVVNGEFAWWLHVGNVKTLGVGDETLHETLPTLVVCNKEVMTNSSSIGGSKAVVMVVACNPKPCSAGACSGWSGRIPF
jgi:hypothetical protein